MTVTARRVLVPGLALAAAAALAGCGSTVTPAPTVHGKVLSVPVASPAPYGSTDTAFGLSLLRAWCAQDPKSNLVFSPSSLATGLGMAYLGARGSTAPAMARVLRLPGVSQTRLLAGLRARAAGLRSLSRPGVEVASSDNVWADLSLVTRRSYLDDVATGYDAGVRRVHLLSDPGKVVQQVDASVDQATRGHIPQLLGPGSLTGKHIGWILTDALYLHAAWAAPFNPNDTYTDGFHAPGGHLVQASYLTGGRFRWAQDHGWTAVSLPYRGHQLSMTALLPPAAGSTACPDLSVVQLNTLTTLLGRSSLSYGSAASVDLPKISLSTSRDMTRLLRRLGMGVAFSDRADFKGLSPEAVKLAFVEHAATMQVAEKGTAATAATAVGGVSASAVGSPSHVVDFNRPYLLLITDKSTGEPLFLARVVNPDQP